LAQHSPGPDVVRHQVAIEAFRLSPDGQTVAFVRRHVDGDTYRSHIWAVSYGGGRARQLTSGALRDSSPTFSPDGRRLAFIRTPEGEAHGQVWLAELDDQPWQLTTMTHGVSSVSWSPDGRLLALVAASDDVPFIVGAREGSAPTARRITRVDWRDDDDGHRDRRYHLFAVDPRRRARPRQLTRGDFDVLRPAWSPDAGTIAFATDMRDERDVDPRGSIWTIAVDGGEPNELVALGGNADFAAYSPDGRWLAFLGQEVTGSTEWEPWWPWVVPAGGGDPRALISDRDVPVGGWAWSDLDVAEEVSGPVWLDDESVACIIARRARCIPIRVALDGSGFQPLSTEDRLVASGVAAGSGRVVISAAIGGRAGDLYAVEAGELRAITDVGVGWQKRYRLPRLDELEVPGPGGPINTWLLSPPDAGDEPLATILNFHGGPGGSFGAGGSLDAMVLTGAGYRVAMPNIRGSVGFGYDWASALGDRWGQVDAEDIFAVVDFLVARGLADPARLGLLGYSYAGFLVQWMIGVSDRFAAAVAENGVSNQVAAWANSYFGVHYNRRMGLADPTTHEGMLRLWRSSPLSHVEHIHTPLLMLQAEEDRNCPASDAEQLFTALRVLGRKVEYVLYPEEHHEMKNYGRPDRRADRLQRILDWFGHYASRR
jgi:dipeptidyl aminopeptidase/acylaminoacyl peptidase